MFSQPEASSSVDEPVDNHPADNPAPNPDDNRFPNDHTSSADTLRLAFRTISTMLDFFQHSSVDGQSKPIGVKEDLSAIPELSQLQLLSALSTVLVRQHEVVSVVSGRGVGGVELFACSQRDVDQDTAPYSPNSCTEDDGRFYATANPRCLSPKGRSKDNEAHIVNDALRYLGQSPCILKAPAALIEAVTLRKVIPYLYSAR
jgi:hypothetical protein